MKSNLQQVITNAKEKLLEAKPQEPLYECLSLMLNALQTVNDQLENDTRCIRDLYERTGV